MPPGDEKGAANLGKNADGSDGEAGKSDFKKAVEQQAELERSKGVDPEKKTPEVVDKDSIDRIFTGLAEMPYDKASEITGYKGFELSQKEKDLNGMLLTYIVMFYLPGVDLGKFALWCFIILNVALLIEKTVVYVDYKKKLDEAKKPKGENDEEKK